MVARWAAVEGTPGLLCSLMFATYVGEVYFRWLFHCFKMCVRVRACVHIVNCLGAVTAVCSSVCVITLNQVTEVSGAMRSESHCSAVGVYYG